MIEIENYNKLFSNNKIKIIYIWILVTIFIITSVIIIIKNIDYVDFYQNKGIGIKEGYIKTIIEINDIEKLVNNNNLVIDKNNYKYEIVDFNENINQVGENFYQELLIKIDTDISTNRYISYKIPIQKYNLFEYIKNKIRGNI